MHSNNIVHLSGGIQYKKDLHTRWRTMEFMPARRYKTPAGDSGVVLFTCWPQNSYESGRAAETRGVSSSSRQ